MPVHALCNVTWATTMARPMYAWWGFLSKGESKHIQRFVRFVRRVIGQGFLTPNKPTADQLADLADEQLFKTIKRDPKHVLQWMCPERQDIEI